MIFRSMIYLLLAAALAGGCGRSERKASEDVDVEADSGASPTEHARLIRLSGEFLRDNLAAYIQRFQDVSRVSADSLAALMPTDGRMLADVLVQAEREMQLLGVRGDARWVGVTDSLRADLTTITQLRGEALRHFLPEHQQRVRRLLDLHTEMMASIDSISLGH